MSDLSNRIALVTGAAGGIGRATAIELARRGAAVVVNYRRSREAADALVADLQARGSVALAYGCDVTRGSDVQEMIGAIEARFGRLDILVNNAGDLIQRSTLSEMTEALFREVLDVNVVSTWLCCQAAAAGMVARGAGTIVNMSSLAAHNGGGPGAFAYAAAKAAIIGMTRGLARELAPRGVRMNCVAPGLIGGTEFHGRFTSRQAFDAATQAIPLGRAGTPEEVANAIAFLASDESSFLVGETIEINGGMLMR